MSKLGLANGSIYDSILSVHESEKATNIGDLNNQYVFKVRKDATKEQIKLTIETFFKVKVTAVNVLSVPKKVRKLRNNTKGFRVRPWKKAYVTLAQGNSIEFTQ